jgi:hypothetical protein
VTTTSPAVTSTQQPHKYLGASASDEQCMQVRSTGPWTSDPCGEGPAAPVHRPAPEETAHLAVVQAARDFLAVARAYKRERDAARDRLGRLTCAADQYLSATEDQHAERLQQLTDEIEAAQHHLAQRRHDDDPEDQP